MTPSHRETLAARWQAVARGGEAVSPCNAVCRMDAASGLCAGCLRTIDEITAWSTLPDAGRRAVWHAIARRGALQGVPAD